LPNSFAHRCNEKSGYRFGVQGQDTDKELSDGAISYKYRIHDPRIGKFLSVDPLAPEYPWNSPNAFSENRVIDGVDLEGLEFLKDDEALVELKGGELRLKLPNLHNPTFHTLRPRNGAGTNIYDRPYVGIPTLIVDFRDRRTPLLPLNIFDGGKDVRTAGGRGYGKPLFYKLYIQGSIFGIQLNLVR